MRTSTLLTIAAAGVVAVNGEAANAYAPSASIPENTTTAIQVQAGFDKADAIDKATQAVQVMSDLAEVADGFSELVSVTSKMGSAIGLLGKVAPFLGAAGFVLGIVGMFMPSEHDMVMKKLDEISDKIDKLEETMLNEFKNLRHKNNQHACYNKIY
jgi:hypothetical protein